MIYRSNKKLYILISATLIVTGLFLPIFKGQAQESSMQSALRGIMGRISSLLSIGGNKELSVMEKQQQELQTRKDTVSKIYDLTLMEQTDLLTRLADLKGLNSAQEKMRISLKNQLAENENSFNQIRTRLETAKTAEEVKQLATDFKNWRTLVYDPKVRKVAAFTFVFQEKTAIEIARQRLEKISADLAKNKESLGENKSVADGLLEKASSHIRNAEDMHTQAKILIMVALTNQADIATPKSTAKNVLDEIARNMTDSKNFTEQSFRDISEAYKVFLEIGKLLK